MRKVIAAAIVGLIFFIVATTLFGLNDGWILRTVIIIVSWVLGGLIDSFFIVGFIMGYGFHGSEFDEESGHYFHVFAVEIEYRKRFYPLIGTFSSPSEYNKTLVYGMLGNYKKTDIKWKLIKEHSFEVSFPGIDIENEKIFFRPINEFDIMLHGKEQIWKNVDWTDLKKDFFE